MMVEVEISRETMDKIHGVLSKVQNADKKVLKPAMARGLMAGKTEAGRKARKTYRISVADFNSKGRLEYKNVSETGNGIIGSIKYSGRAIPLMKFKVSPPVPEKRKMPSAAVLKANSLVKFSRENNVFVAKMKSDHIGIMERQKGMISPATGKEKIKELLSPPVPQMVGNENVMQDVEERVQEVINKRMEHEMERLLNQK